MRGLILAAFIGLISGGAQAAVTARSDTAFITTYHETVAGTPAEVYAALKKIGVWWNPAHTYSGRAASMTLSLAAGACLCEYFPGGSVQHGTVILAWPQRSMVRLQAPLGPLQGLTSNAILTIEAKSAADGKVEIAVSYRVTGDEGIGKLADPVDGVLGDQIGRLARYVATGKPT
jgi:hypothetical protein